MTPLVRWESSHAALNHGAEEGRKSKIIILNAELRAIQFIVRTIIGALGSFQHNSKHNSEILEALEGSIWTMGMV